MTLILPLFDSDLFSYYQQLFPIQNRVYIRNMNAITFNRTKKDKKKWLEIPYLALFANKLPLYYFNPCDLDIYIMVSSCLKGVLSLKCVKLSKRE